MKASIFISGICILGAVLFACDKKVGKLKVEAPVVVSVNTCDTITYEKHIKPIMTANCIACHGAGGGSSGYDLSTYELLKAKTLEGDIKARVIDGSPSIMPQGGPKLPEAQLNLIQCWINNGQKQK